MLRARTFHRKETTNLKSHEALAAASEFPCAPPPEETDHCAQSSKKTPEPLAQDDSQEHDLETCNVTDDWQEIVPITSDEVEAIEAFLRKALDDILR